MAQIKLHSAQDAIEQAYKEGGYDPNWNVKALRAFPELILRALTDPLFWQALGKARGWDGSTWGNGNKDVRYQDGWFYFSHQWFSNRMVGDEEAKFWESLP